MLSLQEYLNNGQTTLSNLLVDNYRRLGMSNDEFLLWIQLYRYHEAGDVFPDLAPIAANMGYSQNELYLLLNQLVQKKLLVIDSKKDLNGRMNDYYEFNVIFEKLELLQKQQKQEIETQTFEKQVQSVYQMFESEFGRALSPIEYQRIGQWIEEDCYHPELIQLALKEAVLNQAYSLNYIDRILLSWERKNITSKMQVEEEQKRRKRQMLQKETPTVARQLPRVSMHNWLEEE